jgi:hypothetical protein
MNCMICKKPVGKNHWLTSKYHPIHKDCRHDLCHECADEKKMRGKDYCFSCYEKIKAENDRDEQRELSDYYNSVM